jgi:O-antigen ligase
MTPLAWSIGGFTAWTVANDFLNSPYTAAGIFNPAFFLSGFVLARGAAPDARRSARAILLVGVGLLGLWALWQAVSGEGRAHAYFETPNTLATILNLALAPLLFRVLRGERRRAVLALALFLSAALASTLSRGGAIALIGALVATTLLFRRAPSLGAVMRLLAVLVAGSVLGFMALQLHGFFSSPSGSGPGQVQDLATTLAPTLESRRELYELAVSALGQHPWLGAGYLFFNTLLEGQRAQVPSYATQNVTYFVHNDYLQTLLELGAPGLIGLLAVIVLPFWLVTRHARPESDRVSLYAALAAVATMAIHALGDFPFYVPLCLLLFGGLLGEIDRLLAARPNSSPGESTHVLRWRAIGVATLLAVLVIPPPLAEAAAAYGERNWRVGNGESAAFGFELARRLQPRDWRYHWYAGQFWYAQAVTGNMQAAPLADRAFAAAVAANPREPRALLARLGTQMRFARMLTDRQPPATLRDWAERALVLAPLNPAVQRDCAAALQQLSRLQ